VVPQLPCLSVLLGRLACGCCDAHYELWPYDGRVCLSYDAHWREFVGVQHDFPRCTFPTQHDIVMQALGTRCMSSDVSKRPNFDEILQLVDELDVES